MLCNKINKMNLAPGSISVAKFPAVHQQISSQLRSQIAEGRFPVGARLPSVDEMARMWGVSAFTIHTALTPLVESGVVIRKRRSGTFVAEKKKTLACVGIYYGRDFWAGREMAFYQVLHQEICRQLESEGLATRAWIDYRPSEEKEVFAPLAQALAHGEFQGLIVPLPCGHSTSALRKLPLSSVFLASSNIPNRVGIDFDRFLELSLDRLRDQGCRNIAVISAAPLETDNFHKGYDDLARLAGDRQMRLRGEWIFRPDHHLYGGEIERFGYENFQRLWSGESRPDGLLVYTDAVARGVILAMSGAQVSVPDELKVVCHRNAGVDLLCPFPFSWVTVDIPAIARSLISQLRCQFAGETVSPICLSPRID